MAIDVPGRPKSLRDPLVRNRRVERLLDPHVARLTDVVHRIRRETGFGDRIPFFDPLDAGTRAECIFILQSPGSKAVASGFVSRDNDDESARHFFELTRDAGLHRNRTITWNAVPWQQDGSTISDGDLESGLNYLGDVLDLLPRCRAFVLLGAKAQRLGPQLARMRPGRKRFVAPLPSPLFINRHPQNRERIATILRQVASYLGPAAES